MENRPPRRGSAWGEAIAELAPESLLKFVQETTDALTITRLMLMFLASILATFTTLVYENRNEIFDTAVRSMTTQSIAGDFDISRESQIKLVKLVRDSNLVNFVSVSQIDLQKNRRVIKFWDYDANQSITEHKVSAIPVPVFDDISLNTNQMLSVLNGEFVCSLARDTSIYRQFTNLPELETVCQVAIPPLYGHASGILTLGVNMTNVTPSQLGELKQLAINEANQIYLREIIKRPNGA